MSEMPIEDVVSTTLWELVADFEGDMYTRAEIAEAISDASCQVEDTLNREHYHVSR